MRIAVPQQTKSTTPKVALMNLIGMASAPATFVVQVTVGILSPKRPIVLASLCAMYRAILAIVIHNMLVMFLSIPSIRGSAFLQISLVLFMFLVIGALLFQYVLAVGFTPCFQARFAPAVQAVGALLVGSKKLGRRRIFTAAFWTGLKGDARIAHNMTSSLGHVHAPEC
jgi:hypothetical protein